MRALVFASRERVEEEILQRLLQAREAAAPTAVVAARVDGLMSWRDVVTRASGASGRRLATPLEVAAALLEASGRDRSWGALELRGAWQRLRQADLSAREVLDALRGATDVRSRRLSAVAEVLARAETALAEAGLTDPDGLELAIARGAGDPRLPALEIRDLIDLPPARRRAIQRLASGRAIALVLPWTAARAAIAAPLEHALRAFEKEGSDLDVQTREIGTPGSLASVLFADDPSLTAPGAPVTLFSAADPDAEAAALAQEIALELESGTAPDRIAIAVRRPARDAPRLLAALRLEGIAAYTRFAPSARDAACARWLFDAAELAQAPAFDRDRLADLVSSPSIAAFARGAHRRARGHVEEVPLRSIAPADLARRLGGAPGSSAQHVLKVVDALLALAGKDLSGAAVAPGEGDGAAKRLQALARGMGLLDPLPREELDDAGDPAFAGGRVLDRRGRAVLSKTLAELPEGLSLPDALELLEAALLAVRLDDGEIRAGAVEVLDVRDLIGRRFEVIALPFLADGVFPEPRIEPAQLADREDLALLGERLGRPELKLRPRPEDALLFALAAEAAGRRLILSRDRESSGSSFADEVKARVPGLVDRRVPATPIPPPGRITRPEALRVASALRGIDRAHPVIAVESARRAAFERRAPAGPHMGEVGSDPAAKAIAAALHTSTEEKAISVGKVERLASCRLPYLFESLLGVERRRPVTLGITPIDLGLLAHRVLELCWAKVKADGLLTAPPVERMRALAAALRSTLREEARAAFRAAAVNEAHQRVFGAEIDKVEREILRLFAGELAKEDPWDPPLVELQLERGFGVPDGKEPALRLPSPDGRAAAWVSGRIDKTELRGGGLTVIDYKTGSARRVTSRLAKGKLLDTDLQLVLYAAHVAWTSPGKPVDGYYLAVRSGERSRKLSEAASDLSADLALVTALDPDQRRQLRGALPLLGSPNAADRVWGHLETACAGSFGPRCEKRSDCVTPAMCRFPVDAVIQAEEPEPETSDKEEAQ